ncbi:MAG: hypothetical protein CM15mP68_7260 [Pseudomonadota bacterium]|nr:MAG: hypothetical protein CM15mP68_7260 [Pseudomonadota bacterium]
MLDRGWDDLLVAALVPSMTCFGDPVLMAKPGPSRLTRQKRRLISPVDQGELLTNTNEGMVWKFWPEKRGCSSEPWCR